jgi:hypothetical protein
VSSLPLAGAGQEHGRPNAGIVGKKAGEVANFNYSLALKGSGIDKREILADRPVTEVLAAYLRTSYSTARLRAVPRTRARALL